MNAEELKSLVAKGESEVLELKAAIPPPQIVARHLASLANTRGGHLVLGVLDSSAIVGVDIRRAERVLTAAELLLAPAHPISVEAVRIEGRSVVIASVKRSERLISAVGGFYKRASTQTRPLAAEEIKIHALSVRSTDAAIGELSGAVAAQTATIDNLRKDFERANSPSTKVAIAVAGAIAGAIAKHLLDSWLS